MYVIKKVRDPGIGWMYKIMKCKGEVYEFVYRSRYKQEIDNYYKDLICGKR